MGYKPTEAIVNNSLKGLALLEKNNSLKAKANKEQLEPLSKSLQGELELAEVHGLYFRLLKARDSYNPKVENKFQMFFETVMEANTPEDEAEGPPRR